MLKVGVLSARGNEFWVTKLGTITISISVVNTTKDSPELQTPEKLTALLVKELIGAVVKAELK